MSPISPKTEAFKSIHASVEALHRTGVIDQATMRTFDASCLSIECDTIVADDSIAEWRNDSEYVEAYDALDEEFAFASEVIAARARAGLSQAQLAERMMTSQSAIARLESGRSRPSVRTLEKLAAATGAKLRISLIAA